MCTGPSLYVTTDVVHAGAVDLLPEPHGFRGKRLGSGALTRPSTPRPNPQLKSSEWEQSAQCRERDTGGMCGVTGDVGDSATNSTRDGKRTNNLAQS